MLNIAPLDPPVTSTLRPLCPYRFAIASCMSLVCLEGRFAIFSPRVSAKHYVQCALAQPFRTSAKGASTYAVAAEARCRQQERVCTDRVAATVMLQEL